MAEFKVEHKKQLSSEHGTVSQRKGETVLPDNRGQVSQARALTDNRTAQLSSDPKAKPNNTGLPNQLKTGIESLSGMSMDHVKVHYNSSQPAQLNAHAYAQGSNIHVASGQEKHLPHEAWHVVQQAQGRVKPTVQIKGNLQVNDDKGLEREADVMGGEALQNGSTMVQLVGNQSGLTSSLPLVNGLIQLTALSDAKDEFEMHVSDLDAIKPKFKEEKKAWSTSPDGKGAQGLKHWAHETQTAAMRHYNELHYVLDVDEGRGLRLGRDNRTEPDVVGKKDGDRHHIEIKTSDSINNSEVTRLVIEALQQLNARAPGGGWYAEVGVFLENSNCTWPFSGATAKKPDNGNHADFINALKKQTSIKSKSGTFPNVLHVTFNVFYKYNAVGYKKYPVDINAL